MKDIKRISNKDDMRRVYHLLLKNNFPGLPTNIHFAIEKLIEDNVYVYLYKEEYLFIYIEQNEGLYLDVCVPELDGKRMNRDFVYKMLNIGYNHFGYDNILIDPQTEKAHKMESKRFRYVGGTVYSIDGTDGLYGKEAIARYFKRRNRG